MLFIALLVLSSVTAALKVHLPLTTSGSTMSVSYAVDFASLLLLGPHETMLVAAGSAFSQCHLNSKDRNPIHRTLFSRRVAGHHGAGVGPRLPSARRHRRGDADQRAGAAAGRRRHRLLPAEHRPGRDRDRALDAHVDRHHLAQQLPVERAELFRRRRQRRARGLVRHQRRLLGRAVHLRAALSDLPHLQGLHGADRRRAAARAADARTCISRRSKRWRARSTPRIRRRRCTSAACRSTPAAWRRKLALPDAEIQGIKTAALLHDIGKLAVPEHILSKPGPLTQEEFQKIRIHPQVGAEIIAAVPFPYPVAPLIMSHHERWDGKGYPQGLAGADIPLGARILTIVDYYDAVTTERPYHKALSYESAIGLLKHEAGRALDPKLVPMFIELLPSLIAELGPGEAESRRRTNRRRRCRARPRSAWCRRRAATRSRTSRSRTARSTRSTRSRSRWAPASASPTRWR